MLSCYWIWGLDKKNRLPKAALCPTPARRDPAFHQPSSLPFVWLGCTIFSFPYPAFHFHLSANLCCQPYRTGIRVEITMHSQLSGSRILRLIYHLWAHQHLFFGYLTCLPYFCSLASIPSFKSSPPHLAASVWSSEVSLDVCQTAQDFVMSPNSISTFCGHFISCAFSYYGGLICSQSRNVGQVQCANHSLCFTPGKNNHIHLLINCYATKLCNRTSKNSNAITPACWSFPEHEQLA